MALAAAPRGSARVRTSGHDAMSGNPVERNLRGLRVLVVEDETLISIMLEDMLAGFGCVVAGMAATIGQALAVVRTGKHFDAAIIDVNIGGEVVFPVADLLLERNVKCVFSTGHRALDLHTRYPGCRRLDKPYGVRELARVLADLAGDIPDAATTKR